MNRRWAMALLAGMCGHLTACQMFRDTDAIELQNPPCDADARSASVAACAPSGDASPPGDIPPALDTAAPDASDSGTEPAREPEPRGVRIVDCSTAEAAVTISVADRTFVDGSPELSAGQVVEWTNDDDEEHAVVSGENGDDPERGRLFDSGPIPVGGSYCLEFSEGVYPYFCDIRGADEMSGTVTVD